jgi:hypothetical protein
MVYTLTTEQTLAYERGHWDEVRVIDDVMDDLDRRGITEVVAVLPADESCVLFWLDEQGFV